MLTGCITILNCMQLLTCMQVTVAINAAKLQLCVHKQNSRSRLCTQKTKGAFTLKWFYALIGIKVGLLQNIFASIRPRYFYFMFSMFTCEKFAFLSVIAFPVHHQRISVNKPPKQKVLAMFFTKNFHCKYLLSMQWACAQCAKWYKECPAKAAKAFDAIVLKISLGSQFISWYRWIFQGERQFHCGQLTLYWILDHLQWPSKWANHAITVQQSIDFKIYKIVLEKMLHYTCIAVLALIFSRCWGIGTEKHICIHRQTHHDYGLP